MSFLIYDFFINELGRGGVDFSSYRGNVLLIVNVASRCGFTPQYKNIQKLHEKFSGKNFSVLAFPCNDFFNQEPDSKRVILEFCDSGYGVTFDMFEKVKVRGIDANPLYKYLVAEFLPVIRPRELQVNFISVFYPHVFLAKRAQVSTCWRSRVELS